MSREKLVLCHWFWAHTSFLTSRYEEVDDYIADLDLLLSNAEKYNEEDEEVLGVVAELREIIESACEKLQGGRAKMFAHPGKDVIDSRLNEKLCTVHVSLMSLEDAIAFNEPVDLSEFPDYSTKVSVPMDLGTISSHLQEQGYRVLSKYTSAVFRVFSNARAYNEFGSAIYVAADMLEAWFRVAVWQLTGEPTLLQYGDDGVCGVTITKDLRLQLVKSHDKVPRPLPSKVSLAR